MPYTPTEKDLVKLGFTVPPKFCTSGIWWHEKAGLWLVLLAPSGFALSRAQYEAGQRHECEKLTKRTFYGLLSSAAPKHFKPLQATATP